MKKKFSNNRGQLMRKKYNINRLIKLLVLTIVLGLMSPQNIVSAATLAPGTVVDITSGLGAPDGITLDSNGNIYVSEWRTGIIKKMDATGGNKINIITSFSQAEQAVFDKDGNLYAINDPGLIRKINADGSAGPSINTGLSTVRGMALDSSGNMYITCSQGIKKLDANGNNPSTFASSLNWPWHVAFDSKGNLYVTEYGGNKIKRISPDRTVTTITTSIVSPMGIAVDRYDNVYVSTGNRKVFKMDTDGNNIVTIATGIGSATLQGIAVDSANNIYVSDSEGGKIKKIIGIPLVREINALSDITVQNGTNKDNINLPTSVYVTLSDSSTTSAAVTWNNGTPIYDGNTEGAYNFSGILTMPSGAINPGNLKASINVIVRAASVEQITTPAAVRIQGTKKVGSILNAELEKADRSIFTTSAAVTYNWYRLNNPDSEFVNTIGSDKNYVLTHSDLGKYIGLRATYDGKNFEDKTEVITEDKTEVKTEEVVNNSSNTSSINTSYLSENNNSSNSSSSNSSSSSENKIEQTTTVENNAAVIQEGWNQNQNSIDLKYIKNGQAVTGWNQIDGAWYLFDQGGTMQIGWKQVNGEWYLLKSNGVMVLGWQQVNGEWYHLNNNGVMETGWQQVEGQWYFLKGDGTMAKDWVQSNGIWYLLKDNGAMAIGWQQENGEWYYLYSDGAMASNTVIDGYRLGENGAFVQ